MRYSPGSKLKRRVELLGRYLRKIPSAVPRDRKALALPPTSVPFLKQIYLLRESFDQNQCPSNEEFLQLSQETCIDAIDVMLWFETERDIQRSVSPTYSRMRTGIFDDRVALCLHHQGELLPMHTHLRMFQNLAKIFYHVENRLRRYNRQRQHLARANDEGILEMPPLMDHFRAYHCTKQSRTMADWREHQKKVHFSEKIYECWENKTDGSPCLYGPVLRADNLRTHLVKVHQHQRSEELITVVNNRARIVQNLYHEKCGFASCDMDLNDFDTSMKHIARHISSGRLYRSGTTLCSGRPQNSSSQ